MRLERWRDSVVPVTMGAGIIMGIGAAALLHGMGLNGTVLAGLSVVWLGACYVTAKGDRKEAKRQLEYAKAALQGATPRVVLVARELATATGRPPPAAPKPHGPAPSVDALALRAVATGTRG